MQKNELLLIRDSIKNQIVKLNDFEVKFKEYSEFSNDINKGYIKVCDEQLKQSYINEISAIILIVRLLQKKLQQNGVNLARVIEEFDKEGIVSWVSADEFIVANVGKVEDNFKDVFEVIRLFTDLQNHDDKKLFGQYYTPQDLVRVALEITKINYKEIKNKKIVDPACGDGAFIVGLLKEVIKEGVDLEYVLCLLKNNISGYDINPFAVLLCKLNIFLCVADAFPQIYDIEINDLLSNIKIRNTILQLDDQKYDYIIGNPPFFKVKNSLIDLDKQYKNYFNGQINIYAVFIIWSMHNCNDNGDITLILPQSFRSGAYFEKLRIELEKWEISDILYIDINKRGIFKNAEQAILALHLKKRTGSKNVNIHIFNDRKLQIENSYAVSKRLILRNEGLALAYNIAELELFNRIIKNYGKFKEIEEQLAFGNGLFVWNQNKEHLSLSSENAYPIVYANYIHKEGFVFAPQDNSSEDDKSRKPYCRINEKIKNFLRKNKTVFVKRTSGMEHFNRITASAVTDEFINKYHQYYIENHVNFLYNKIDVSQEIEEGKIIYIQAFLNSDIASFIFGINSGNTQVSASELNSLPFRYFRLDDVVRLAVHGDFSKVNEIFYEAFNCTPEEITLIKNKKEMKR